MAELLLAGADRLADYLADTVLARKPRLVLLSGIGSAYPIVRSHELLNNLHRHMESTPLVMFYPGVYDSISLKLFGKAGLAFDASSADRKRKAQCYRAFRLVD